MPPVANPDVERWESDEDSENSGDEREGDEQEVALSEAAILRLMGDGVMCVGSGHPLTARRCREP